MHDLPSPPPPPPPPWLAMPPKNLRAEMAGALVGLENVQCTIVAMEQAGRQTGGQISPPLLHSPLELACLPDSPPLDSLDAHAPELGFGNSIDININCY